MEVIGERCATLRLLVCALTAACGPSEPRLSNSEWVEVGRPDVILIVVDTLRQDHLGIYGYPRDTSPEIDALARQSVLYTRAFSQAPWTTPAIGALLSSRYPTELGITNERSILRDEVSVLPEALARAGYATGAVVSHSFCSAKWGFAQGFADFDESNVLGHAAVTGAGVTNRAIEFLDANPDAPVFLFAHYFDPHFSYIEDPAHEFGGPRPGYAGRVRSGMLFSELREQRKQLDAADLSELRRIYDSEIRRTDAEIGRLLVQLRNRGRLETALVIITADHGEGFMEHGYLGHAKRLDNVLVRVPLIVQYPGVAPAVISEPVGLIDVYPTILEFLGLTPPEGLEGTSLFDRAAGAHRAPEAVFSETDRHRPSRSVAIGDHKLILDVTTGDEKLFDIARDPDETRDLSSERPQLAMQLRQRLERWRRENQPPKSTREIVIGPEERARLEHLGYL